MSAALLTSASGFGINTVRLCTLPPLNSECSSTNFGVGVRGGLDGVVVEEGDHLAQGADTGPVSQPAVAAGRPSAPRVVMRQHHHHVARHEAPLSPARLPVVEVILVFVPIHFYHLGSSHVKSGQVTSCRSFIQPRFLKKMDFSVNPPSSNDEFQLQLEL